MPSKESIGIVIHAGSRATCLPFAHRGHRSATGEELAKQGGHLHYLSNSAGHIVPLGCDF